MAHWVFFNRQLEIIPLSDTIYCFCNPAVFPLFYIYIEELTLSRPDSWRRIVYLIPSLICFFIVGSLYLMMDVQETSLFVQRHLYGNEYQSLSGLAWWQGQAHLLVKIVFAVQIPFVLVYGWRRISQYNSLVESNYSNTEGMSLASIRLLLILFVLAAFFSFILNVIGRSRFADNVWLVAIPSMVFSMLMILFGHVGLIRRFSIVDAEDGYALADDEATEVSASEVAYEELKDKIIKIVDQEQLFLRPNLKINDLAKRLNTNRNYIYNAINVELGVSFSEFINQKRIEYAVRQINRNPKALLADVATAAGYSSVSTFYRNFRQFKQCNPSQYQKEVQEKRLHVHNGTPTENRTRN